MNKSIYKIGDEIFCDKNETLIGTVVGINETHWSYDKSTTITYTISTPHGRLRRVYEKDIEIKSKKR